MGLYRKLHLFDVQTPEFKFRESKIVAPGPGLTKPVDSPIGKIGMQICYDIRFPEAPIWLKKQGAQILLYPSAFAVSTGKAHWEILNRSRAIENQCFVISAAQVGKHNEKRSSFGQAIAISPWGDVLAQCKEELEVQFVDIDLESITKVESNMPCFQHRRDDVYSVDVMKTVPLPSEEPKPFVFEKYTIDRRTIFLETEFSVAFTNIKCVVPGHVLIATKRCIPRVENMTSAETKDLFLNASIIAKTLDKYHDAKSTTITGKWSKSKRNYSANLFFLNLPQFKMESLLDRQLSMCIVISCLESLETLRTMMKFTLNSMNTTRIST